jgi:hypothetical protein
MDIEGEMRAVKRHVSFEGQPKLPAQRARDRLQARPEQPVMHDKEIDVSLASLG